MLDILAGINYNSSTGNKGGENAEKKDGAAYFGKPQKFTS